MTAQLIDFPEPDFDADYADEQRGVAQAQTDAAMREGWLGHSWDDPAWVDDWPPRTSYAGVAIVMTVGVVVSVTACLVWVLGVMQ